MHRKRQTRRKRFALLACLRVVKAPTPNGLGRDGRTSRAEALKKKMQAAFDRIAVCEEKAFPKASRNSVQLSCSSRNNHRIFSPFPPHHNRRCLDLLVAPSKSTANDARLAGRGEITRRTILDPMTLPTWSFCRRRGAAPMRSSFVGEAQFCSALGRGGASCCRVVLLP
jgi:hypothetical protein